MAGPTSSALSNPFPGLRPFRESEEHLFFGRESQVDRMIDKLARTRFLTVIGTSGSGKSSLVNCGLRPALHRGLAAKAGTSWRMAQFRPGSNPLRALARALAVDSVLFRGFAPGALTLADMNEASLRMSKLGLVDVYEQAQPGEGVNLLVIADQFEELFRYSGLGVGSGNTGPERGQDAKAFVNLLLQATGQMEFPIYVVVTMRSDFLGDCAEFPGLPEAINEGQYLVPRMTREERRAAIAGPVRAGGGEISPVLLTRLVNDVGDNPDQLSILQHALNRTWSHWQYEGRGEGPLDLPHYEAIGTMSRALDQHAEKAYGELQTDIRKKICEKIFKALTDKGTDARGIRRPTNVGTLCALAGAGIAEVTQVIDVFRKPSRSFLMPPLAETVDEHTVIDISHESLMRVWDRLAAWANDEAQSAQLYRRLSEDAALFAQNKTGLWRDPQLELALEWQGREKPVKVWGDLYGGDFGQAMNFLAESQAQREREVREREEREKRELHQARALADERAKSAHRLRIGVVVAAVLTIAALAACVWALLSAHRAYENELEAVESQKRAEKAENEAVTDKTQADESASEARAAEMEAKDLQEQAEGLQREEVEKSAGYLASQFDISSGTSESEADALWQLHRANLELRRATIEKFFSSSEFAQKLGANGSQIRRAFLGLRMDSPATDMFRDAFRRHCQKVEVEAAIHRHDPGFAEGCFAVALGLGTVPPDLVAPFTEAIQANWTSPQRWLGFDMVAAHLSPDRAAQVCRALLKPDTSAFGADAASLTARQRAFTFAFQWLDSAGAVEIGRDALALLDPEKNDNSMAAFALNTISNRLDGTLKGDLQNLKSASSMVDAIARWPVDTSTLDVARAPSVSEFMAEIDKLTSLECNAPQSLPSAFSR